MLANIHRHYELKHSDEPSVQEIIKLKDDIKKTNNGEQKDNLIKKKEKLQALLRNRGNFSHNIKCLKNNQGNLMVVRRPEVPTDASAFLPCPDCLGFYMSSDIFKHSCPASKEKHQVRHRGEILLSETLKPILGADEDTLKIVREIKDSNLRELIQKDSLILKFCNHLVQKHSSDSTNQDAHIRERTRVLAKFVRHCKNEDGFENHSLTEILSSPLNYDLVARCAQTLSKSAVEMPRKIGHTIRKCLVLLKGIGLRTADEDLIRNVQHFNDLMGTEWTDLVSSKSLKKQHQIKMNKDYPLPTTPDVTKLYSHITEACSAAYQEVMNNPSKSTWRSLAESLLGAVVLFNKRRSGEASRIRIDDVSNSAKRIKIQEECCLSLSSTEKEMITQHFVIYSAGKKGRHVPTILTNEMKMQMDLLLEKRNDVGIDPSNHFVFANQKTTGYIRASDVLRKFAEETSVKNCTSTSLRKYLATTLQCLNLTDEEKDQVFRHMGHSRSVHEQFYRMDERTVEAAKLSKLLHLNSKGNLHTQAGKTLAELEMSPEELDLESDDEEKEDHRNEDPSFVEAIPKKIKRRPVSADEIAQIEEFFSSTIEKLKNPTKIEILEFATSLDWTQVKGVIYNIIKKKKKMSEEPPQK